MSERWEQLLYTSVDHVVDGRASSGWQVKSRSGGMDDDLAQELVNLVQPQLMPIIPLSGFPTEAELATADRRLTQRLVRGMPVLLHTAPAGQDTTGRPNTVTHVLVDRSVQMSRPLLGAGAWRAPWWSTPYGAEAVRGAALAPQEVIGPGDVVTSYSAAALIAGGTAAPVLAALADTISQGDGATSTALSPLAVLVIDRADDVPQWIGALERTCAAEAARSIQWSSLERVSSERDLEALRDRGLSVVGVPRADVSNIGRVPAGCLVLDPESPTTIAGPRTPWGRFVHAMAADFTVWNTAMDALATVAGSLEDPTGVTFAWSAAMAQIVSPGLLDKTFVGDARAEAVAIVTTTPVAGAGTGMLSRYLDEVVNGLGAAPAGAWYDRLSSMSEDAPVGGIALKLAERYMDAVVTDREWLLSFADRAQRPAGLVHRALEAWSTEEPEGPKRTRAKVEEAQAAVDADGGQGLTGVRSPQERRAGVLVGLSSDGLTMPTQTLSAFLLPIADSIVQGRTDVDSRTIGMLPAPLRDHLRTLVDDSLSDQDRRAPAGPQASDRPDEPRLEGQQMRALVAGAADLDHTPYVGLQANLTELIERHRGLTGRSGGTAEEEARGLAESCLRMLEAIAAKRTEGAAPDAAPQDTSITLTGDAAKAVGALFPLSSLGQLSRLLMRSQADHIADRIALRDIEAPATIEWARGRVGAPGRPPEIARLILAAAQPLLSSPESQWKSDLGELRSAAELAHTTQRRPGGLGGASDQRGEAAWRRLLDLVQVRWDAATALLRAAGEKKKDGRPPEFMDAGFVSKAPARAEDAASPLVAVPRPDTFPLLDLRSPLGSLSTLALQRLMDDTRSGSGHRGRSPSRTGRLDPALRDAAIAILRAYVRGLGGPMEPTVHEQLTTMFTMDHDAVKQAEQILGIGTSADRFVEKGMAGAVSWTRGLLKRKEERDG